MVPVKDEAMEVDGVDGGKANGATAAAATDPGTAGSGRKRGRAAEDRKELGQQMPQSAARDPAARPHQQRGAGGVAGEEAPPPAPPQQTEHAAPPAAASAAVPGSAPAAPVPKTKIKLKVAPRAATPVQSGGDPGGVLQQKYGITPEEASRLTPLDKDYAPSGERGQCVFASKIGLVACL